MKYSNYLLVTCVVAIIAFQGCKKESPDSPAAKKDNTICDGNGSNVFYPLTALNSWEYTYKIGGIKQSSSPKLTVKEKKETIAGKTYSVIVDESNTMFTDDKYYREDASTHNIYMLSSQLGEFLEIPGSPSANQSWTYRSYTRKVTNLSASISTASCSYSGLLEISEYDGTELRQKMYYKKGLGMVYRQEPGVFSGNDDYTLSSVTLK